MRGVRVPEIAAVLELPLLLILSPLLLFPTPARAGAAILVPLIWLAIRSTGRPLVPRTPLNPAVWVLLVMVGVSVFVSLPDVQFSLGKICGVVLGAALFWAVTRAVTTRARLAAATAVFVLSGCALATAGLLGTRWLDKFPTIAAITASLPAAIRGVPGAEDGFNPNPVAGSLLLFLPLQVLLFVTDDWRRRLGTLPNIALVVGQLLALGLTTTTFVLSQSRNAWISLALAGAVALVWRGGWGRTLVVLLMLLGAGTMTAVGPTDTLQLVRMRAGPGATDVAVRYELWSRAVDGIMDFPLTGMGMNNFRRLQPLRYPAKRLDPALDIAHAHNNFLQTALDLGLPGMLAYVALWLGTAFTVRRTYVRTSMPGGRALASGLAVGLLAHFFFGLNDAIPLGAKVGVLFWLALALVCSAHRLATPPPEAVSAGAA